MIVFVRAVWMNLPLNIFSTTITVLTGLVIYAFYASCDPGSTGEISTDDEVLTLFFFLSLYPAGILQADNFILELYVSGNQNDKYYFCLGKF